MLYSLRGALQVDLDGRIYDVHPGDLFLILPDELHKLTCKEWDDVAYWDIQFDRELLTAVSQAAKSGSFLFSFTSSGVLGQRLFERGMLVESPLASMLDSLLEEYENPRRLLRGCAVPPAKPDLPRDPADLESKKR